MALEDSNPNLTAESLRQVRESLSLLTSEVQGLRERLLDISRIVQGADNPESLHLQFHLFKKRFEYLEAELEELRNIYSKKASTRDERGWQLKHTMVTVVMGLLASGIPVVFQYWSAVVKDSSRETIENPWKQN